MYILFRWCNVQKSAVQCIIIIISIYSGFPLCWFCSCCIKR